MRCTQRAEQPWEVLIVEKRAKISSSTSKSKDIHVLLDAPV